MADAFAALMRQKKTWAPAVLHHPHLAESISPDLIRALADGHIFVFAVPVSGWACANTACRANNAILKRSGLDGEFTGAPQGEDGYVLLPQETSFVPLGGKGRTPLTVGPQRFRLEVGTIASGRVLSIFHQERFLARLPYDIKGVAPHLFLLAYAGPVPTALPGSDLLDALVRRED